VNITFLCLFIYTFFLLAYRSDLLMDFYARSSEDVKSRKDVALGFIKFNFNIKPYLFLKTSEFGPKLAFFA